VKLVEVVKVEPEGGMLKYVLVPSAPGLGMKFTHNIPGLVKVLVVLPGFRYNNAGAAKYDHQQWGTCT